MFAEQFPPSFGQPEIDGGHFDAQGQQGQLLVRRCRRPPGRWRRPEHLGANHFDPAKCLHPALSAARSAASQTTTRSRSGSGAVDLLVVEQGVDVARPPPKPAPECSATSASIGGGWATTRQTDPQQDRRQVPARASGPTSRRSVTAAARKSLRQSLGRVGRTPARRVA